MTKAKTLTLLLVAVLAATHPAMAQTPQPQAVTASALHSDVPALLQTWLDAVASGKAENVAALYAETAVLLPTLSPQVLDTPQERLEYFKMFVSKPQISGKVDAGFTRTIGDRVAVNSGVYTFSFVEGDNVIKVPARYTFVYEKTSQGWRIVEHHSSKLP